MTSLSCVNVPDLLIKPEYVGKGAGELLVFLDVLAPLWGNIFQREYCRYWADWDTGPAVDALIWVNVELVATVVNALNWANLLARAVFDSDAGFSNYMGHINLVRTCA